MKLKAGDVIKLRMPQNFRMGLHTGIRLFEWRRWIGRKLKITHFTRSGQYTSNNKRNPYLRTLGGAKVTSSSSNCHLYWPIEYVTKVDSKLLLKKVVYWK